jgi:hypothetical protein
LPTTVEPLIEYVPFATPADPETKTIVAPTAVDFHVP